MCSRSRDVVGLTRETRLVDARTADVFDDVVLLVSPEFRDVINGVVGSGTDCDGMGLTGTTETNLTGIIL